MSPSEYQQLVEFLGQRFGQIDQRFGQIDQRFGQIDRRFDQIDQRFDQIDQRFDQIDRRFILVDRRLNELEAKIESVREEVADLRQEMLGHFDTVYGRLEGLEQEYRAIIEGLRRIEARLGTEAERRDVLERDLAGLRREVELLRDRIGEVERRLAS